MNRTASVFLYCLALGLWARPAHSQSSPDSAAKQRILQLEEERRVASLRGDTVQLGKLLADGFFEVGAAGQMRTRKQNFSERAAGDLRIDSLTFDSVQVSVFGSVAVAVGVVRRSGMSQGKRFDQPPIRYSKVYVRDSSDWHIVFGQNTPIIPPKARD